MVPRMAPRKFAKMVSDVRVSRVVNLGTTTKLC